MFEVVLTSTHNLCFGAKIRKIGIPFIPQFGYIKVGFKGVYIARICFPDEDFKAVLEFNVSGFRSSRSLRISDQV